MNFCHRYRNLKRKTSRRLLSSRPKKRVDKLKKLCDNTKQTIHFVCNLYFYSVETKIVSQKEFFIFVYILCFSYFFVLVNFIFVFIFCSHINSTTSFVLTFFVFVFVVLLFSLLVKINEARLMFHFSHMRSPRNKMANWTTRLNFH